MRVGYQHLLSSCGFDRLPWPVLQPPDASSHILLSHPVPPQPCTSNFPKQHLLCPSVAKRPCGPPLPCVLGHNSNWLSQPSRPITVWSSPTCSPIPFPSIHIPAQQLLHHSPDLLQVFTILYFHSLQAHSHCMHIYMHKHVSGTVQGAGNECRDEQGTVLDFLAPIASAYASLYAWNACPPPLPRKCSASTSSSKVTLSISLCQLSWVELSCTTLALITSAYLLSKVYLPMS